jgi:hypothetical protein
MVGLFDQSWLSLLGALALVGYWFSSRNHSSVKVKVLGGGFGLWLGDNIAILSILKRAHLLFLTLRPTYILSKHKIVRIREKLQHHRKIRIGHGICTTEVWALLTEKNTLRFS